jgi:hypothetical protein
VRRTRHAPRQQHQRRNTGHHRGVRAFLIPNYHPPLLFPHSLECVFLHGFRKVTNFFGKPKELLDFLLTAKASCKYVPKLLDAIIKTVPKAKTSKGKGISD